jgi:hypothetical protein
VVVGAGNFEKMFAMWASTVFGARRVTDRLVRRPSAISARPRAALGEVVDRGLRATPADERATTSGSMTERRAMRGVGEAVSARRGLGVTHATGAVRHESQGGWSDVLRQDGSTLVVLGADGFAARGPRAWVRHRMPMMATSVGVRDRRQELAAVPAWATI